MFPLNASFVWDAVNTGRVELNSTLRVTADSELQAAPDARTKRFHTKKNKMARIVPQTVLGHYLGRLRLYGNQA